MARSCEMVAVEVADYGPNLHPFGVGIYNHQEHVSTQGTSIVHVKTRPGALWPLPGLNGSHGREVLRVLAMLTGFHLVFKGLVQSRPPDK